MVLGGGEMMIQVLYLYSIEVTFNVLFYQAPPVPQLTLKSTTLSPLPTPSKYKPNIANTKKSF